MTYRPIEFPFTKNGWTHELVARQGLACIVRRHKKGRQIHFEVIYLKERPASTFKRGGKEISVPPAETYPLDEDWGTYGFTYRSLEDARGRMAQLLK